MEYQQQKLEQRNTFTPTGASQACCSVVDDLNRDENLSDISLKTCSNHLDVNLQSGMTEQNLRVPVLNMRGKPLMPTTPRKARILIETEKAIVVQRLPFMIQLKYQSGESKQEIVLGVDGGRTIGFSLRTEKQELIRLEVETRNNVSQLIQERRMYRIGRRNKLWYRKPRFLNRTKSKKKGWLPPSIKHKMDAHSNFIIKLKQMYPITKIIFEVSNFDIQKINNPEIKGVEYQQGPLLDYENIRQYIFTRDHHTCQICKQKGLILEIHHIIQRKDGGTDKSNNLVTLCVGCHKKFHQGKIKKSFNKPNQFKESVYMNCLKKYVIDEIGCDITYGYITKYKRKKLGLEKSHTNDAFIISNGTNQIRSICYHYQQIRRNNRCLQLNRKGYKPSIRKQRYKIQPNDIIKYKNNIYVSSGAMSYGRYITFRKNNDNIKYKKLDEIELLKYHNGYLINRKEECLI